MNLSCPYCNHGFTQAENRARVTCPRCGEAVAVKGQQSSINPIMARDIAAVVELGTRIRRRVKQAMIAALLLVLILTAIAFWMLLNKKPAIPPVPASAPNALPTPPLELRGLGYLPPNCNVVFAVQPGPLLVYAAKTQQDPVELLTKNLVPAFALSTLAKAGITLQQIDHIVGGFNLPDENEEPRICVVLVLHRPLSDEASFLEQLQAKRDEQAGPERYEVRFDKLPLKLAKASDAIWVFGFTDKDLPARGGSQLTQGFRDMIGERVPNDAAVWVAADSARWSDKPLLKLLKKEWLPVLAKGRAAAVSYSFGDQPLLRTALQCADGASAEKLRTYFKGQATGEHSSAGGAGDWATLELAAEPKDVFTTVKGFFGDAAR